MKRLLCLVLIVAFVFAGCGKQGSNKKLIAEQFETIMKTSDSAVVRNNLSKLSEMTKDSSLSEEDKMFAQFSYNVAYGIAKLSMSGESVSVFDFPDIEILTETVEEVKKGNVVMEDIMVSESKKFVDRVEKFLK